MGMVVSGAGGKSRYNECEGKKIKNKFEIYKNI